MQIKGGIEMSPLTPQQLKRRRDYELSVRKRQPKLEKLVKRASCLLGECGSLTDEERAVAAKALHEIADRIGQKTSGCHPT